MRGSAVKKLVLYSSLHKLQPAVGHGWRMDGEIEDGWSKHGGRLEDDWRIDSRMDKMCETFYLDQKYGGYKFSFFCIQ